MADKCNNNAFIIKVVSLHFMKNKVDDIKIITTDDGSHSIFNVTLNETYHSIHGAVRESDHVFIHQGLLNKLSEDPLHSLNVLEIGFGTGLNALLTAIRTLRGPHIRYTTLEPFPLSTKMIKQLNYPEVIQHSNGHDIFQAIHYSDWGIWVDIHANFSLLKLITKLQDLKVTMQDFDLIYFDAFAPGKQPEVWHKSLLQKMFTGLKPTGMLVTYCAQGQFKRDLHAVGFSLETLPGPPGKKEMVRARKP